MISGKGVDVGSLKIATIRVFLFTAAFGFARCELCRADVEPVQPDSSKPNLEPPEQQKPKVLQGVAQDWILVGITEYKRGLYEQAEKSFLNARELQEYLTAKEYQQLEEHLERTHQAVIGRHDALEHIKTANDLLNQGQPVKARAYYEKVLKSPFLTEQERRQIASKVQKLDENFNTQTVGMTALYNRSVALYRAGELEEAREGFAKVARSGLVVAPESRSAEDYLVEIDSILTERLKHPSKVKLVPPPTLPITVPPAEKPETGKRQMKSAQEQAAEVATVAEPSPTQPEPALGARTKILRTYTKAVVEDAIAQVQRYIIRRDFDKAIDVVRNATDVVRENRPFLGDELFARYSVLLKQLVDRIIDAQKPS